MQKKTVYFISYLFIIRICWYSARDIYWYSIYLICWYTIFEVYNFVTYKYWIISNTFSIHTILTKTCYRMATIIFFIRKRIFIITLTFIIIPFLLHVLLSSLHLKSYETIFVNVLASFIFVIILNTLTSTSFISFL